MDNKVSEEEMLYMKSQPVKRIEPPRDFGDIRKSSIDASVFPYSPQPMNMIGEYCIYAYHLEGSRVHQDLGKDEAYLMARVLNERYWKGK